MRWDNGELWFTVVGVVGDVHQHSLSTAAQAEVYVPYGQDAWATSMHLLIRGSSPDLLGSARSAVWSIDPDVPVTELDTMERVVDRSLATARFHSTLFGLFAVLATVLAAVGVYGVTSYTVSLRTREIGIRLAFGATSVDVVRWLVKAGGVPIVTGLVIGVSAALLGQKVIGGMLYGIAPTDPEVFLSVIAALVLVAGLAMAIPARKAWRVDPIASLNSD